jgi:hypothetical protein
VKRKNVPTAWRNDVAIELRNRGHEKESVEWMKCGDPAFIRSVKTCADNPEHYHRVIGCSCHLRICPECSHRDGARLVHQYLNPVKESVDHKPLKWSLKHIVLTTIHNLHDADAYQQYRRIYKDADTLFNIIFGDDWQQSKRGLLYAAEWGEETQHLHLHCLILCEWIDQDYLSRVWELVTGNPIVFIRRVQGVRKGVQEICKYATKLTQLSPSDAVLVLEIIKGSRRVRSRGIYYGLPEVPVIKITICKECGAPIIQMFPADFDAWIASLKIEVVEDGDLLKSIIGNKSGVPPPHNENRQVVTVDLTEKLWSDYEKLFGHQHRNRGAK